MYLIRFSLAFILLVGIFACKDKGTQTNDIQDTAEDFPDLIENEFVRIEKGPDNNLYEYQIRTEAEKPVLIQKNGQAKIYDNLEDISYDDFSKNSFILLPAAHSLLENPFKNESAISALAPTRWGRSLVAKKEELNNILFLIEKNYRAPEHPTLETEKINELFGDYTKNLFDEGKHKVYSISFKGRELALK